MYQHKLQHPNNLHGRQLSVKVNQYVNPISFQTRLLREDSRSSHEVIVQATKHLSALHCFTSCWFHVPPIQAMFSCLTEKMWDRDTASFYAKKNGILDIWPTLKCQSTSSYLHQDTSAEYGWPYGYGNDMS